MLIIFSKIALSQEKNEDKIKKLALQLRCMTCQNQSVYESDSDFSKDIIEIIEKKLKEGEAEEDIKSFLTERYGEYILFKPKFDKKNLILWIFPFALFGFFLVFFGLRLKKK